MILNLLDDNFKDYKRCSNSFNACNHGFDASDCILKIYKRMSVFMLIPLDVNQEVLHA